MDEKEMKDELAWVKYRINMLNIMEEKLMQMKEIAEKARCEVLAVERLIN